LAKKIARKKNSRSQTYANDVSILLGFIAHSTFVIVMIPSQTFYLQDGMENKIKILLQIND